MITSMNVNGFCGLCNKCKPYWKRNKCLELRKKNMQNIIDFFKIISPDDLIILQEVPFGKNCSDISNIFESLYANYNIIKPDSDKTNALQCTLAITSSKSNWIKSSVCKMKLDKNKNGFYDYINKFVELTYIPTNTQLLGVHMPCNTTTWNNLIETISFSDFSIIIGDFNAHINEHRPHRISKDLPQIDKLGYTDLVGNNVVTYYPAKTTLDHLYIRKSQVELINKELSIIPTTFSDHATIQYNFSKLF